MLEAHCFSHIIPPPHRPIVCFVTATQETSYHLCCCIGARETCTCVFKVERFLSLILEPTFEAVWIWFDCWFYTCSFWFSSDHWKCTCGCLPSHLDRSLVSLAWNNRRVVRLACEDVDASDRGKVDRMIAWLLREKGEPFVLCGQGGWCPLLLFPDAVGFGSDQLSQPSKTVFAFPAFS